MAKKKSAKSHEKKPGKSILTKDSLAFLERYLNNPSPTGFESEGQRIWLDYIKPYVDTHLVDNYGTVVGIINPEAEWKVVIEAHADEISWFVHYITKEGFIYVRRNGGSDHMIAPSKRVNIHTDKGIVKAVFGWPAIHVRTAKNDPVPTTENIFLDCGCASKEEVEKLGVHVGCVVTFEDEFMVLNWPSLHRSRARQSHGGVHDRRSGAAAEGRSHQVAFRSLHHQQRAGGSGLAWGGDDRRAHQTRIWPSSPTSRTTRRRR